MSFYNLTPASRAARLSRRTIGFGAVVAWIVGCVLLPLLAVQTKRSAGGSNVDDFLYASLTLTMGRPWRPAAWMDSVLSTGSISPLVPALTSLTRLDATPYMSTVTQLILLSLLFWSSRGIAHQLQEPHPTLLALAASTFPAMIGWAAMFHFAVATSALLTACVWTYVASEGLTKWGTTLLFGCSLGALTLARSVAVVYVVALLIAVAWHWLRQPHDVRRVRGLAIASTAMLLIAAPWWLRSGSRAIHYLMAAGYDSASGFAPDATVPERVATRVVHTITEWGWPVVVTLALLVTLWIASAVIEQKSPTEVTVVVSPTRDLRRMLLLLVGAGLAILSSSSNLGTAFSLPFAPLVIVAIASGTARLRGQWSPRLALASLAILATFTIGTSLLSISLPTADAMRLDVSWHSMLHDAGWSEGDRGPEEVHRDMVAALQGRDVLVLRDDALFNVNGLSYTSEFVGPSLGEIRVAPYGEPGWVPSESDLGGAIVIDGSSPAGYHTLSSDMVATRLRELNYAVACETQLGARNTIKLWAPAHVQIVCPR